MIIKHHPNTFITFRQLPLWQGERGGLSEEGSDRKGGSEREDDFSVSGEERKRRVKKKLSACKNVQGTYGRQAGFNNLA